MRASNAAKWAKNRGISKLHFVLGYGFLFGLFVTILSRVTIYLLDLYYFPGDAFLFKPLPTVTGLIGTSAAGFYLAALVWERIEKEST